MGWFQAPRNLAFTMIGWLYGDGDFARSICIAVNCGDDTDCTGATLGSILGITGGMKAIPVEWRKPIGNKIATVAISGFDAPSTLDVLTDSTFAMAKRTQAKYNLPFRIGPGKTSLKNYSLMKENDRKSIEELWKLSPWKVVRHNTDWVIMLDYLQEPYITGNSGRKLVVSLSNVTENRETYNLKINGLPESWHVSGLPADTVSIEKMDKKVFDVSILADEIKTDTTRMQLILLRGADSDTIPVTLFRK